MYIHDVDSLALIADPVRRRIVEILSDGERTAGQLAGEFDIARTGVSRHLRLLREGGVVSVRRDAQRQIYRLEPSPFAELDEWLATIRTFWTNRLDALDTELRRGPDRPETDEGRHDE